MPSTKSNKLQAKALKPSKGKKGASSGLQKVMKYKGLILIIVVAYLLLFLVVNYFFFSKKEIVRKEVQAKILSQITGLGKRSGAFIPQDVAAISNDKLVVSDDKNHKLLVFDRNGDFLKGWDANVEGKDSKSPGGFASVSTNEKGDIYVINSSNSTVWGFNPEGHPVQKVNLESMGCYAPRGVYWSGNFFLVADTGGHRVLKVASDGTLLEKWGQHGNCKDCFNNPYKVVSDGKGNFYISDYDNSRVKYVDGSGKVIKIIKVDGRPNGIAVDGKGNLYVGSTEGGGFVKVFNPSGAYLGDLKDVDGADPFTGVRGLGFMPDGTLLLGENENVVLVKILQPGDTLKPATIK